MINWLHIWPEKRKRFGTYSYYTCLFSILFSYLILISNLSLSCCTWNSIYNHGLLSFFLLILFQCFLQVSSPFLLSSLFFNSLSAPLLFIKSAVPPPFADPLRQLGFLDLLVCAGRSFSAPLLSHGKEGQAGSNPNACLNNGHASARKLKHSMELLNSQFYCHWLPGASTYWENLHSFFHFPGLG